MDFFQDSGHASAQAALGFWHEGFKIPRANRIVIDLLFEEDFSMENGRCPWRSAPVAFMFVNFFPDQRGPEGDDSDPAQPCGQRNPATPMDSPATSPRSSTRLIPMDRARKKQGGPGVAYCPQHPGGQVVGESGAPCKAAHDYRVHRVVELPQNISRQQRDG